MRNIKFGVFLLLFASAISAQTTSHGVLFSKDYLRGSARFISTGGSMAALGGDYSAVIVNPAGIGVYRNSDLGFGLTLNEDENLIKVNTTSYSDYSRVIDVDLFNLVSSYSVNSKAGNGILNYNFGFGYNRLANYDSYVEYYGIDSPNSITDFFASNAYGINYDDMNFRDDYDPFLHSGLPWESIMAWQTYLIDTIPSSHQNYDPDGFVSPLYQGDLVDNYMAVLKTGSKGEYNFSFGANYENKLFFGASMGIQVINYYELLRYEEELSYSAEDTPFNYLQYDRTFLMEGTGVNFKAGIIYKPVKFLNIGLALHSPTFYRINYDYDMYMKSDFLGGAYTIESPVGYLSYQFETPLKVIASTAFFIGNKGFLSAEYELVDYTSMHFSSASSGESFLDLNSAVDANYGLTHNYRFGGEYRIRSLSIRAGYSFYANPYKNKLDYQIENMSVMSGGLGYFIGPVYFNLAYSVLSTGEKDFFYKNEYVESDEYTIEKKQSQMVFSMGFKF